MYGSYVNNAEELFNYTMDGFTESFHLGLQTAKSGEGAFEAVCLSGVSSDNNTGTGAHFLDSFFDTADGAMYIIIRPTKALVTALPDPRNFDDIRDIENIIAIHGNVFLAKSSYTYDSQRPINFGQVISCRFEEGSVFNSDFRGLVFDEPLDVFYDHTYRNLATFDRLEDANSLYASSSPAPLGPEIPYPSPDGFYDNSDVPPMLASTQTEVEELAAAYDAEPKVPIKSHNDPRIAIAHPDFQKYIKAFIYKCWRNYSIIIQLNSTFRNRAAQDKLIAEHARGERKIKPATYSYHLAGLAFDFNPYIKGKVILSKAPKSQWISSQVPEIGKSLGLRWGGNFSTNYDPIHFDLGDIVTKTEMKSMIKEAKRKNIEATAVKLG